MRYLGKRIGEKSQVQQEAQKERENDLEGLPGYAVKMAGCLQKYQWAPVFEEVFDVIVTRSFAH